jgi:N-acetylglucosaminyl-diphospho-decaprenol L-rhamnosyltransferase
LDNAVPAISVILVNYNTAHLLDQCISDLRAAAKHIELQLIVVDNASRDDSRLVLQEKYATDHLIFNPTNVGFGRANNQALAVLEHEYVLLLNTDAFVAPDTLDKTLQYMQNHPDCGVLGVRLKGRDGVLQPSCRYFPTPLNTFLFRTGLHRLFPSVQQVDDMQWDHASPRGCDWVPGCYYLTRRSVINQVGLFDPRFFLYFEEVDHCKAVKAAGHQVIFYSDTTVIHIGGESAKSDNPLTTQGRQVSKLQIESETLYFRKHFGLIGVLGGCALNVTAEMILALKLLIKQLSFKGLNVHFQNIATALSLLVKTRLGTKPLH